ncbi:MAG: GNAT family N-acetyltransferase [Planctomycetota bacterium]|nr:MAG: GNAT family N-acetyltransferase [Planctomycetota bacterium]
MPQWAQQSRLVGAGDAAAWCIGFWSSKDGFMTEVSVQHIFGNHQEPLGLECWRDDRASAASRNACDHLLQGLFESGLDPQQPASARVLVWREQQLVASAACRRRGWPLAADRMVSGAHVGYVCSHPDFRGCGYALIALRRLMAEMEAEGWLPGILHCVPALVPFYGQAGWISVAAGGIYSQASGEGRLDPDPVMAWDPRPQASLDGLCVSPFPLGDDW